MKNIKSIGLIGGMGPHASSYFYDLLIKKSEADYGAKNNNDYPRIILDSLPVPDFISDTNNLTEAKKLLIDSVIKMNNHGISVIAMTCNTAHILYKDIQKYSKEEFLSLIDLTVEKARNLQYKRVGIIATPTTIKSKLYQNALCKKGIFSVSINDSLSIEKIIRGIIAGEINKSQSNYLYQTTKGFIKQYDLDAVILGCTELPLIFPKNRFNNVVDCLDVLADELLSKYYV